MTSERKRIRTVVTIVLVTVVVVGAAVALTAFLRSPTQRLERAANDLNSMPGVESARVDDSGPAKASAADPDPTSDQVAIALRDDATRAQVVALIKEAAKQTSSPDRQRIFYVSTGRATTCVCDDTTDAARTVAAQLLALRTVSVGAAYVYDDTSVGLDPPGDESGDRSLAMSREALGLLAKADLPMPRSFKTYNGRIQLDATPGSPAQMSRVLLRSRSLLVHDWRVRWLSGRRLYLAVPPGITRVAALGDVRRVAGALGRIRRDGHPLVARVVASSADRTAYANVAVR